MLGKPHQIQRRIRRAVVPISVSALMAFALFPALAGAESSDEIQYRDVPLGADGTPADKQPANSSRDDRESGQSPTEPGSSTGDSKGDGSSDESGAGAGANRDGGNGQGGAGKGSADKAESGPGDAGAPLDAAPASSSDGSSPLVPILIALAVLAAISIGAVAWRRRRGGDADSGAGSPVSPEAS